MTVSEAKGYKSRLGQESEVGVKGRGSSGEVVVPSLPALEVRDGPLSAESSEAVWPPQCAFCIAEGNDNIIIFCKLLPTNTRNFEYTGMSNEVR